MRDYLFLFLVFVAVLALVRLGDLSIQGKLFPSPSPHSSPLSEVKIGNATVLAEIAESSEARARGLSERAALPPGQGMLFVFPGPGRYSFWMAGMRFPIDVIWISEEKKVVGTDAAFPPQSGIPVATLPRYEPPESVRYVLEVNAGWAAAHGIRKGDPVSF